MFETPSPYSRPSSTNGLGWNPGTCRSHGSRPLYDVSMCPLNIRAGASPDPASVPSTFARPSSTCCHWTASPISVSVSAISSAIACSSPVKLGTEIAASAKSTSRCSSTAPLIASVVAGSGTAGEIIPRVEEIWSGELNERALDGVPRPRRVRFYDTTLRDGEQTVGVVFTPDQKLAIAHALDELGVERIEAGFPRVSEDDRRAVELIRDAGLRAEIWG